ARRVAQNVAIFLHVVEFSDVEFQRPADRGQARDRSWLRFGAGRAHRLFQTRDRLFYGNTGDVVRRAGGAFQKTHDAPPFLVELLGRQAVEAGRADVAPGARADRVRGVVEEDRAAAAAGNPKVEDRELRVERPGRADVAGRFPQRIEPRDVAILQLQ